MCIYIYVCISVCIHIHTNIGKELYVKPVMQPGVLAIIISRYISGIGYNGMPRTYLEVQGDVEL